MAPLWFSTIYWQMARPIPVPSYIVATMQSFKGTKNPIPIFFIKTDPLVLEGNFPAPLFTQATINFNFWMFVLFMKFDGIGQEVLKQLLNFRAVALDSG